MTFILNLISKFIPIKYSKLIIALVILLLGLFSGYKVTYWYYISKISELEYKVQEYTSAYSSLAETTNKQNSAIIDLQSKQSAKQEEIELAQYKAKKEADNYKKKASEILKQQSSGDKCRDASMLIDNELKKER